MDSDRKHIILLGVITLVIVGLAYFSVKLASRGSNNSDAPTTSTSPGATSNAATTQQAKDVTSLQTATAFVWKDILPLSTPPYARNEFYLYRDNKTTKLTSKNGTLTEVFAIKG